MFERVPVNKNYFHKILSPLCLKNNNNWDDLEFKISSQISEPGTWNFKFANSNVLKLKCKLQSHSIYSDLIF